MTSLSVAFDCLPWCLYRLNKTELCELWNQTCPRRSKQLWPSSNPDVEQFTLVFWRTKDRVRFESWMSADIRSTPGLGQSESYALPLGVTL